MAVDASGAVTFTGALQGTVDFGGGPLVSAGGADIFVVRLDPAGGHVWSRSFGDLADQAGGSVALDPSGAAAIATISNSDLGLGSDFPPGRRSWSSLIRRGIPCGARDP